MNQKNDRILVPSDYCLISTCVIKYRSVVSDQRRIRSIHCLNSTNSTQSTSCIEKSENQLINSSLLNQYSNCSCSAIHYCYSSGLNEESLNKYRTNQSNLLSSDQIPIQSISSSNLNHSSSNSSIDQHLLTRSTNETVFNQQQLVDSSKTASTSTINSKLKKNTGRISSASGHRMPNNTFKNVSNSSSTKLNENVGQQNVGGNAVEQQTSTNQTKAQPTRITDQDAIQLLAEDVESRLEALLRTFIQEEKLRQEARYNSLMGKRSASLSALNSEYNELNQDGLNIDYSVVSPLSRSLYSQQLISNNNKHSTSNQTTNKSNIGYVKPQQHRMQQSYQLHNSQNIHTPQQQKPTAIKTSSHRLDSSPSRSNVQNSKLTNRNRSPSPTGRTNSNQSNIIPVNRNNLFGQHTRTDQNSSNKTSSNKPVTTNYSNYLNLHQRSLSPSKDAQQNQQALKNHQHQSSHLVKQQQIANNSLSNSPNQTISHSSHHRLYSPSSNNKLFYDPFGGNSSQFNQFGRSKDDSHIRRVVVYNLNKEAASAEKKPVIIEGSKSMNGTLNNNFNSTNVTTATSAVEQIGTNLNDNQAIRSNRSAKTTANSPSRGGMMMNGTNIGSQNVQQSTNVSTANRTIVNSSANTTGKSTSSSNNSGNSIVAKKQSSNIGNKVITSTSNRLTTGHETSALQLKDQNNHDYSTNIVSNVGGSSSAAQLNTERKVVRKVIVKELDGLTDARIESAVNSSNLGKQQNPTYQQQKQQRLSPILNGDLNSAPKMATLNTQQSVSTSSLDNNQQITSLNALLNERNRILTNREQYKQKRNNVLNSTSDANNNYILSKSHKNELTSTTNSSAAGLLINQTTNRNLPLSASSTASKRKPLVDRYSPFSIVNEQRQRWEENVIKNANDYSTSTGNQSNGQYSASLKRANSVKPFLSKGSVAERVMLFEKHPQLKQIEETEAANRKEESAIAQRSYKSPVPYSSWREKNKTEVINLSTSFEQNLRGKPPLSKQQNLSDTIPKFFYPYGKPINNTQQIDQLTKQVNQFFKTLKDNICTKDKMVDLCKASNFPIYWKEPLFLFLAQNNQITHDAYLTFWRRLIGNYFDEASKFVFILSKGKRNCLLPEDFIPMIQDVIDNHPGLLFLKFACEFHSRYVHTVIARIYYCIVKHLQEEDDINQITDYFSYEHFYVIYCRFWSLDKDHDLVIDKYDLSRHNEGAISSRMIERIFSGAVTQSKTKQMTYQEFVFFLISEEDKKTETAIEYWFRCMDLDGDGYLSFYELEYFYEEQFRRMSSIGIEALPFSDIICQMMDMINPEKSNKISLSDLKKCSMTYIFLDTFFNLHKYLLHEQKEPSSNRDDQQDSDWNRFAAEEYAILVQEEQNQMSVDENENESENYDQQKYSSFVYDEADNEFRINQYPNYDEYDTTDQEDYLDNESLY